MESRNGSVKINDKDDMNTKDFKHKLITHLTNLLAKTKMLIYSNEDEKIPD